MFDSSWCWWGARAGVNSKIRVLGCVWAWSYLLCQVSVSDLIKVITSKSCWKYVWVCGGSDLLWNKHQASCLWNPAVKTSHVHCRAETRQTLTANCSSIVLSLCVLEGPVCPSKCFCECSLVLVKGSDWTVQKFWDWECELYLLYISMRGK